MIRIISVKNPDLLARQKQARLEKKLVQNILDSVKKQGDAALRRFEKKFNGVDVGALRVSEGEITQAYKAVTKEQILAIREAKSRLAKSEGALKAKLADVKISENGISITKSFVPLQSVGCYVPGGLAVYPSSAVMSVVPAKTAGVKRVVVVTPPNKEGKINPAVLVAASICGADEIFKVGGAHAIAALAYGTKSIRPVDKIVGPGGAIVTTAKYLVSDTVSIDMLAGPTELAIIADDSADPDLIASDLISQSEHSSDTTCCLITTSRNLADGVVRAVKGRLEMIRRGDIVRASLGKNGFIAVCKSMSDVIKAANAIAPEHLQVMTRRPQKISDKVTTAGLVLLGHSTPSAASDYLLGTNHILPTNRFGRSRGSLSTMDFLKIQTTVESSAQALRKIDKNLKTLTESENLPNHYEAVKKRL